MVGPEPTTDNTSLVRLYLNQLLTGYTTGVGLDHYILNTYPQVKRMHRQMI